MTMPPPTNPFDKQLADWRRRLVETQRTREILAPRVTEIQTRIETAQSELERVQAGRALTESAQRVSALAPSTGPFGALGFLGGTPGAREQEAATAFEFAQEQLQVLSDELLGLIFDEDLFSVIPALVSSKAVNTVDEALALLSVPTNLSERRMTTIRTDIEQLIAARDRGVTTAVAPPELSDVVEVVDEEFPKLIAPPQITTIAPQSIHQLTTNELLKTMRIVEVPETNFTQEQWNTYLADKGWSDAEITDQDRILVEQLVTEALNRKNMVDAFRAGGAQLPTRTAMDVFQQAIVNPPLVVLEGLNFYYEHVSIPAAGWLYSKALPDIQKAVEEFRRATPDSTMREAYVYAWNKWEAPGPPVLDFILKYMLMEGLVDPLTYVGWGIGTKFLKALGPVGRVLATGNRAAMEVMELPFDAIKYIAKNVIPKTIAGRATMLSMEAVSEADRAITRFTNTPMSFTNMNKLSEAAEFMIRHIAANPRAEDDVANGARVFLAHSPVSKDDAVNWITRLRAQGARTIDAADLLDETILDLDTIFERVFSKEITVDEAAPLLLNKLGIDYAADATEDMSILAAKFLSDRGNLIADHALDFTFERNAQKAMKSLERKLFRTFESREDSIALRAAQRSGRFQMLIYNVERGQVAAWTQTINRMVVRTAAEAYLTFGLYGPMNVFEDYFRSILGGVKPGHMSIERWDIQTLGLKRDPSLRVGGISEQMGFLRDRGDWQRSNWILTMSLLPLSLPTWAVTRGRVTPKKVAQFTFYQFVERFGGYGADIRRNFTAGRAAQILADLGGDSYKLLDNLVPSNLTGELANAPRWVKRNLQADLRSAATTGKLTTDNIELVKTLKDKYTRNKIVRAEVQDVVMKYEDLSPTVRSFTLDEFDEKRLLQSPDSIDSFGKQALELEQDDFLRGPERATQQYDELTKLLVDLDVSSPTDMVELITSLHRMTATYGALPDEIIARATIKSRGLPHADRKLQFDTDLDRVSIFVERAGADIDRVIEKIRTSAETPFPRAEIPRPRIKDPQVSEAYDRVISALPDQMQADIKGIRRIISAEFEGVAEGAGGHVEQVNRLRDKERAFDIFIEPGEDLDDVIQHELLHVYLFEHLDLVDESSFLGHENAVNKLQRQLKAGEIANIPQGIELSVGYQDATRRYHEIVTATRKLIADAKNQDIAFRNSYFAGKPPKFGTAEANQFWDDFYATEMAHWNKTKKQAATLNSQLMRAVDDINTAAGGTVPTRSAVVVRGRPLAPTDVSKLMGTRNDDISKLLLDTLLPEGDKDYFTEFVLGLVKDGDEGFDRASIEAVYDQIADSILVDPLSSSWFRAREKQIGAMTRDFHDLFNAKLFPEEQKVAVDALIDDVARGTADVIFEPSVTSPFSLQGFESRIGPGYRINLGGKEVGTVTYRDLKKLGIDGLMIGEIGVERGARRQGAASLAIDRILTDAEEMGLPLYTGTVFPDGRRLLEGLEKSGLITLEATQDTFLGERIVRGAVPLSKGKVSLVKQAFSNYDDLRQTALDEATKWYFKEYPDYTNANAFDAMMKQLYPFWTYESQRWLWLPRSFMRHPGTLTAWGRWMNNTDNGYVHIPGTSIDIHPGRGNVYGAWSTRMMRRDYPEYYDQLEGFGGLVEFFDFLSRYGFYPNVIVGGLLAQFGGTTPQTGGILPSAASTPLNAMIAAFPDNEIVKFISEKIFPNQFRTYLTSRTVDDLGGDGSLLFAKMEQNIALTEEERALWDSARGTVAAHSAAFEQFGMFRMKSDEALQLRLASEQFIEEQWGFTPEQQRLARQRGDKLWDIIGGLDPWETAVLQELEFFKYSGSINPVLPGRQQEILNRIETDWFAVTQYSESMQAEIIDLQEDFLVGSGRGRLGPDSFLARVRELQRARGEFIDNKTKDNPLMLLENRTEYYQKYGQTMPVQSPYNELLSMFYAVELEDTVDEATGERVLDWNKFWANRDHITSAIPIADKGKWDNFLARNTAPIIAVWQQVSQTYFKKYNGLWDEVLSTYSEEDQTLITEYLFLERTQQKLDRQEEIKAIIREEDGLQLISGFRTAVSDERKALRFANPQLDAWLFYWGKTSTFVSHEGEGVFKELARQTGRVIE